MLSFDTVDDSPIAEDGDACEAGAFMNLPPGDRDEAPDLQCHFLPARWDEEAVAFVPGAFVPGVAIAANVMRPRSRDTVSLRSADPFEPPAIDLDLFADPDDLELLADGVEALADIAHTEPLARMLAQELEPTLTGCDRPELLEVLRETADHVWHAVGTCKMGSDPAAVVDDELRVHGVAGLRVADASIMPTIVSGNTNAATIMIAEKAADLIRGGWGLG